MALLFCFESIDEDILRSGKNLKVAQRYGIGVDNIDINVATELGVVVANIPDYCIDEVSDHAMSMILSLNRLLSRDSDLVKKGMWNEIKKDKRVYRLSAINSWSSWFWKNWKKNFKKRLKTLG